MSRIHSTPDISHILCAAIATPADTTPRAVISQAEEITGLERLNKNLKAEKDSAVHRAAKRYTDMMHANRRAERAEQALKHESLERQDDQIKAFKLFCSYKTTINNLEVSITQAQRTGSHVVQFQALQAADAGPEATFGHQKRDVIQTQISTQKTIEGLAAKIESQKAQTKQEAEQLCEKRIGELKKQMCEQFSRRAESAVSQVRKELRIIRDENEVLKKQLHETQQKVEWHKTQAQQQSAQRLSIQDSQAAIGVQAGGICAGFPLQLHQDSAQAKDTSNKRRRFNSLRYVEGTNSHSNLCSNASVPAPNRKGSRGNSIVPSIPTTTLKRKPPHATKERGRSLHHSVTPTRQNTIFQEHQYSKTHASSVQPFHQPQSQTQASPSRDPSVVRGQQHFHGFFQDLGARSINAGYTQMSPQEALLISNDYMTRTGHQQLPIPTPSNGCVQPMLQQHGAMGQTLGRTEYVGVGPRKLILSTPVPSGRQAFPPFDVHPPPFNQRNRSMSVQQSLSPRAQQRPLLHENIQGKVQLPEMSRQDQNNLMPTLTASHEVDSSAISPSHGFQTEAIPQQMKGQAGDLSLPYQLSSRLLEADSYLTPDDSQVSRDRSGHCEEHQSRDWGSPMPKNESEFSGASNGRPPYGDPSFQDFANHSGFTAITSDSAPVTGRSSTTGLILNDWTHEEVHSNLSQQALQQHAVDPAVLFKSERQVLADNLNNEHTSSVDQIAPFERPASETPSVISPSPSQLAAKRPPTSRKRPVLAPSVRSTPASSVHSTPAPAGTSLVVCLHCHENWWNASCDVGEPCQNCIGSGKACERPKCLSFEMGACPSTCCSRVHEGDQRYKYVVEKPKTLKRTGKREDRKQSPMEVASQQWQMTNVSA